MSVELAEALPSYCLFWLDGAGRLAAFMPFEAANDADAIQHAITEAGEDRIELWCENRRLPLPPIRTGPRCAAH